MDSRFLLLISRHAVTLALIGLIACSRPQEPQPAQTPAHAVQSFYDWRIRSQMIGAPTPAQLASMSPYISKELQGLLAQARSKHEKNLARAQSGKPAFIEGDLFSSLFEGPTSFTTGEVESADRGDAHVVPVRFVSARQLPAVNWVDRVWVIRENGNYVIADIEYGNHWDFGSKGTLTGALSGAKKKSPRRA